MPTAHSLAHSPSPDRPRQSISQEERPIVPAAIWLCYLGQRVMRGAALWEGVVFIEAHPEYANARWLQAVMIALEAHGAWRCFKHLPSLHDAPGTATKGSSKSGKVAAAAAAHLAPAADGSPRRSPCGVRA